MAALNLALRFMLELAGIGALAFRGWNTAGDTVAQMALSVGAPLLLVLIWAFVVAPKAKNLISQNLRVVIGSGLLLLAAGALAVAGQQTLAAVFAAAILLNTLAMFIFADGLPSAFRRP